MKSLSLLKGNWKSGATRTVGGWEVPWEVMGYQEDYRNACDRGGLLDFSHWRGIQIKGPDAFDFLNRMTTLNFQTYPAHRAAMGAFLTHKSGVIAMGFFQAMDGETVRFWVSPEYANAAKEHIEKFHFAERMEVTPCEDAVLFAWWGTPPWGAGAEAELSQSVTWEGIPLVHWHLSQMQVDWVLAPKESAQGFLDAVSRKGEPLLGMAVFEYHRVASGIGWGPNEVSERTLILAANLEWLIDRGKGCYPGQEVVERIFTYGQVNRKLLPVRIQGPETELPQDLLDDERKVGQLVTRLASPESGQSDVGLAFLHRDYWNLPSKKISIAGGGQLEIAPPSPGAK